MRPKVVSWGLLAVLALGFAGCGDRHEMERQPTGGPAVAVQVETVATSDWPEELRVTASVLPLIETA